MTDRDNTFSGWCCTDCLFLLANGEAPADWSEDEVAEWKARIAHYTEGCEITLGMFREDHGCATDWTVTWHAPHRVRGSFRRGYLEVRADSYADAMDAVRWAAGAAWSDVPAGAWAVIARSHDLQTESDRGGECECEQLTFSSSPCDVCRSGLAGSRDAVVLWFQPETAVA